MVRARVRAIINIMSADQLEEVLTANGAGDAAMVAGMDRAARVTALTALLDNLDQAERLQQVQPAAVHYDYNVDGGDPLSETLEEFISEFPTLQAPWNNRDRSSELRPYRFPSNFMPERRRNGIPDAAHGPWAPLFKKADTGSHVLKADKIAATTQKAIEDTFRPYFSLLARMSEAEEAGTPVTSDMLDDLFFVGKSVANASVLCENNRVKQILSVLKPGSEELYNLDGKAPLMNQQGVSALELMQATNQTAKKLEIAGMGKGRGRGRYNPQNSRARGAPAPGAPLAQATGAQDGKGQKGKGRGRGKGRN